MADASTYDPYVIAGLNKAQGLMSKEPTNYPSYVPSQAQSPTQQSYYNYTPTAPMANINAPNYEMKAGDAQAWNKWTPQAGNNYQEVNPNAQAANFSFQTYGVNAPKYQGLMGGDYDALQTALTSPGAAAAQSAYNQGTSNLTNTMGGRGLYGSSIMQQQQTQGLDKTYQQSLADNAAKAAAQRYGMQQSDLANASAQDLAGWQARMNENLAGNSAGLDYAKLQTGVNQQNVANSLNQAQSLNALRSGDTHALNSLMAGQNTAMNAYNQAARGQDLGRESELNKFNLQNFQLGEQQNKDIFSAGLANADRLDNYQLNKTNWDKTNADNLRTWQNAQNYEQNFLYPQQQGAYQNQADEMMMNRALALAGQGAPLSQAASNYQLAQQQLAAQHAAAQAANQTANTSSYLGAAGLLGGGLLSKYGIGL